MLQTVITLVLFLFPLAYSPGPGNMFFAANGARFGFRPTISANVGYHIATWVVTFAIGLGCGGQQGCCVWVSEGGVGVGLLGSSGGVGD